MTTLVAKQQLTELWDTPKTVYGWLASVDHKDLGIRYLVTAFVFLIIGGLEALVMRLQLTRANETLLRPEVYNQIFSMHGITMIFWYASPILSGFSVYLVPLMAGARDVAYPRLNSFTYWSFLFSGILLYIAPLIGQAPHAGWFSYMPYTNLVYSPTHGMDFYALSIIMLGISTTGAAINFIATILWFRAPGMAISKMPLFLYSTLTISVTILFAMPALTVACIFLELERRWGMHFFDVASGGTPLLWQQLFWFFGHPWVYVIFLPATGMVSIIIPVFSRRPIVGYPYVAMSTVVDRGGWFQRVAPPYVHGGHVRVDDELLQRRQHDDLHVHHHHHLRLAGDRMEGPSGGDHIHVVRSRLDRPAGYRRTERRGDRHHSRRLATPQYILCRRPYPLRAHRRERVSRLRWALLLAAEDDWPHDERAAG